MTPLSEYVLRELAKRRGLRITRAVTEPRVVLTVEDVGAGPTSERIAKFSEEVNRGRSPEALILVSTG